MKIQTVVLIMLGIPENDIKHIPCLLEILPVGFRRLDTRWLLAVEYAPVHGLVYTGTFRRHHLPCWSCPLRWLSIDSSRHVLPTDSEISRGHVGFMGALKLLCQNIDTGLQAVLVIVRTLEDVLRGLLVLFIGKRRRRRFERQISMEGDQRDDERNESESAENVHQQEGGKRTHRELDQNGCNDGSMEGRSRAGTPGEQDKPGFLEGEECSADRGEYRAGKVAAAVGTTA